MERSPPATSCCHFMPQVGAAGISTGAECICQDQQALYSPLSEEVLDLRVAPHMILLDLSIGCFTRTPEKCKVLLIRKYVRACPDPSRFGHESNIPVHICPPPPTSGSRQGCPVPPPQAAMLLPAEQLEVFSNTAWCLPHCFHSTGVANVCASKLACGGVGESRLLGFNLSM